jgi:hypothetical protein
MGTVRKKLRKMKLYIPACILYGLVAFYLIYPIFVHKAVAEQVKNQLVVTQANEPQETHVPVITGTPKDITIKRIGINLPVGIGNFSSSDQKWTLDQSHIFVSDVNTAHPIISNTPSSQPYKTVFYGHHSSRILGLTDELVPGDILTIDVAEGYTFTYYFNGDNSVSPRDISILHTASDSTPVALITCTGPWDQSRRVMYFSLLGEPKKTNSKVVQ